MTTQELFRDNRQARITRAFNAKPCAVKFVTAEADAVDFRAASGGQLHVPTGVTAQTLTVHTCATEAGTYLPLIDADGDPVTIAIVASKAYDLPEAIYACGFVKLQGEDGHDFVGTIVAKG
jgi:hypothetical protein